MKLKTPLCLLIASLCSAAMFAVDFGPDWNTLDSASTGEWWNKKHEGRSAWLEMVKVPRDEVVAFAVYTVDRGTLKMTAQLFPLRPDEARLARLELKIGGEWQEAATAPVYELGWSAHFRLEGWDEGQSIPYRVRHGKSAVFEGLVRRNPHDKNDIVIGSLSCNSNQDRGDRDAMVANLKKQDPDMLFFCGRPNLRSHRAYCGLAIVGIAVSRNYQRSACSDDS
jgi:hypothetical protein